jgi:phage-related holin
MLIEQILFKMQELTSKILDVISSNQLLIIPLAILSNFFINVQWYFYIIFIVIVIDIITALLAAKKNNVKIESNKFFNSIVKIGYYYAIMDVLFLIDYFVIKDSFILVNFASVIILINELISIDENICKLIGRNTALTKVFRLVEKLYYDFIKRFVNNKGGNYE